MNKKKPQIVIQKTNHSSTSSNKTNMQTNFSKKWLSPLGQLMIFPISTIGYFLSSSNDYINSINKKVTIMEESIYNIIPKEYVPPPK